jgi:ATP-binding cassette, subfamily B, bacterial PglK
MPAGSNFITDTYKKIKNDLPDYVFQAVKRLIPIYLISTVFEIFGLVVLFPVIEIVLKPEYVNENKYLLFIYQQLHFTDTIMFVVFLFCSITLIFILKNLTIYLISNYQSRVAFKLAGKLSLEKYMSYIHKPYHFHAENNTGVLLRNITQIPFELITYIVLPFIAIVTELFILSLIVIGVTLYDPLLFWSLILLTVPFLFIYNKVYKSRLKEISERRNSESSLMYKLGLQSMEAFREITVFNKSEYFKPLFQKTLGSYTKSMADIYLMNIFSPKIVETVAILGIFFIFILGYILNKDLTTLAQFLIIFAIAAYRVIPSLNKIILCSNYIKSSFYIFQFFHKSDDVVTAARIPQSPPLPFEDKMEIKDLSFGFADKSEKVLKNISLEIKKGSTIGIIGPSGAGKTTLLNILLRLFEETSGGIYVDGVKIDKQNLSSWYKLVSYVPQNITILDGSFIENIAFGIADKEVDHDLLKKVVRQAQLDDFINGLPNGLESQIGEKGIKISGGQRQRVGIARALYHGGKILVFDEATSALDTETEKMLTESINNISHKEHTIIIVAHRIQTLKYCDSIYQLQHGKLSEAQNIQHH